MRNFKTFKPFKFRFTAERNKQFIGIIFFILLILLFSQESSDAQTVITLNPANTYQAITGWEGAILQTINDVKPVLSAFDELFNQAVNDLGINRIRLEIAPGIENTIDYGTQYINDQISELEYLTQVYNPVNDNPDPFTVNSGGFHFSVLDWTIDNLVLKLKSKIEAKGEKLFINLTYVDFYNSSFEHYNDPEEYAEFVLATYQHLQSKYGFVPDAWEMILEPDNSDWNGARIGNCLVAAANRLKANGFTPRFIAPSNTYIGNAITYFDEMIKVPGVLPYLSEFSYHRYWGGATDAQLLAVAGRAVQYGFDTAMLEWWDSNNGYQTLHKDLKLGRNSAWQQGIFGDQYQGKTHLYNINNSNFNVTIHPITKFTRQYFKFIRPGAIRIGATSNNGSFDPLAFINKDSKYIVVVKAGSSGSFTIQGLPAGTYGIKYTTNN